VTGLGVLPGMVRRLPDGVKHPQMQWNQLDLRTASPLFAGLGERPWMYFVHSFARRWAVTWWPPATTEGR